MADNTIVANDTIAPDVGALPDFNMIADNGRSFYQGTGFNYRSLANLNIFIINEGAGIDDRCAGDFLALASDSSPPWEIFPRLISHEALNSLPSETTRGEFDVPPPIQPRLGEIVWVM